MIQELSRCNMAGAPVLCTASCDAGADAPCLHGFGEQQQQHYELILFVCFLY
jgi:hypothetical protein